MSKRIKCNDVNEVSNEGRKSSYAGLKNKLVKSKFDCEQMRMTLLETQRQNSVLVLEVEQLRAKLQEDECQLLRQELYDTIREKKRVEVKVNEMGLALQDTHVQNRQSEDLVKAMGDTNVVLRRQVGILRLRLEQSKTTIRSLSDAYDVMVEQVEASEAMEEQENVKGHKINTMTVVSVCRAFGWSQETADPILLRAACGFWEGCSNPDVGDDERVSCRARMNIWQELTCRGFKGKLMDELNQAFKKQSRFDVVELARRSDINCQFNATAVGAVSHCELGKKKYDRGILCSDATLRRTQKQVLELAKSLGFTSYPTEEEGKVWCWGDDHGDFVTGVNRYVYEIYVKARCPLVTKDQPWIVSLSGDLARVSTRGKAITMMGPKITDPRLPCQQATGKTSNQSRNLYTPAAAGYVDETHLMKYFDRMVAAFREIQERGYCVVGSERYSVFIDVIVVADMSYLHKYLRRGGGSHSCTNFCFLCSVNAKYRQEGYPGGCLKCRSTNTVYDETTGAQQCRHHDVCDKIFLQWETERWSYLEENVKPRIPASCKPYYECLDSLREVCVKRCRTPREIDQVAKKKTYAALEKWLLADGRTREGCDLSCNIHTGIRICPLSLVREDLRLRGVRDTGESETKQRQILELLLREEEEYLKLRMYLRDHRFRDLLDESGHRTELHKTILDMLHCPMRTNEKVLNLLYEEVSQGAHKAEMKATLDELTTAIRRVGDLPPSFTHKFEKKNSKVLEKIKLPFDLSRKLFAIHQLDGLREVVHIAVPASEIKRREEWMTFLYHYVHVNATLQSTLDYTAEDIANLESHIDAAYGLLVTTIGGKERGVTNYFHYLGSGHVVWMIKIHGNLWRFCNEGVESINALASKRYNGFNNKGGYKATCKNELKRKCLPFEVLGSWLSRLSMWHIGTADTMFSVDSIKCIKWKPEQGMYGFKNDIDDDHEDDSEWTPLDWVNESSDADESDTDSDEVPPEEYESDDDEWCFMAATMQTWVMSEDLHTKRSNRVKYQLQPLLSKT